MLLCTGFVKVMTCLLLIICHNLDGFTAQEHWTQVKSYKIKRTNSMIDYLAPLNVKLRKDNAFKFPLFLNIIYFVNINKKRIWLVGVRSMGVNA